MDVLDGMEIVEGESALLRVNVGHPIITSGDVAPQLFSAVKSGDALFPNYFGISCFIFGLDVPNHYPRVAV